MKNNYFAYFSTSNTEPMSLFCEEYSVLIEYLRKITADTSVLNVLTYFSENNTLRLYKGRGQAKEILDINISEIRKQYKDLVGKRFEYAEFIDCRVLNRQNITNKIQKNLLRQKKSPPAHFLKKAMSVWSMLMAAKSKEKVISMRTTLRVQLSPTPILNLHPIPIRSPLKVWKTQT